MNRSEAERHAQALAEGHEQGQILTVGEAARVAGVSGERISQLKCEGTLPPIDAGALDYIWYEDLQGWMARRKVGRPKTPDVQ